MMRIHPTGSSQQRARPHPVLGPECSGAPGTSIPAIYKPGLRSFVPFVKFCGVKESFSRSKATAMRFSQNWVAFGSPLGRVWAAFGSPLVALTTTPGDRNFLPLVAFGMPLVAFGWPAVHSFERRVACGKLGLAPNGTKYIFSNRCG